MTVLEMYPSVLLALCLWREARGESREVKAGIKHVILNRAAHPVGPFHRCHDVVSNILCPAQFTSFHPPDANASKLPDPSNSLDWRAWLECCAIVDGTEPDPTGGANYYHDLPAGKEPRWADPSKLTATIGATRFYKL